MDVPAIPCIRVFFACVVLLKKRTVPENVCFSYAATSRSCVDRAVFAPDEH